MRPLSWASGFTLLTVALPAFAQKLIPVNVRQYEAAFGLQRRDFDHLQDFHPQAQTELIYGLDQAEDRTLVANITLQESPGLPIVLLERFEHLTADVDCRGRSGHMSLRFTSEDTFQQALKAWRYINDHVDHQFLLIANHNGCAPDDDRQPYIITQITDDPVSLTTHLKSRPVEWKHISENLEMTVAAVKRHPSSIQQHPLNMRDLPDKKSKLRSRDVSEFTNRGDPFKLDYATKPGKKVKILQSISNDIQGFCTNCLARGSFLFTFSVSKKGPVIDASNLSISGSNIEAAVTLSLLRRGQNHLEGVDQFSEDIDVLGTAVPGLGWKVGNWANLGLTWAYQLGYSGSISGNFEFSTTIRTKNPGSSLLTLDLIRFDTKKSNVDNWAFFEPEFNIVKLEGGGSFEFHGQLAGIFGFELIDKLTLEARVAIPVPMLKFQLTPQKNQGGLCKAAGIDTGVVAQVKFGTQITISGTYKFPGSSKDKQAGLDPIIDATFPIGNPVCVAVKVPIVGEQGKKPLPGQKPSGAKPAAAGTKELSYDPDLTPEEFSGRLPSITYDDHLVASGATLDDGSTPGLVTMAFDDPELTAMQADTAGVVASSGSGSTIAESNPPGDMTAGATGNGVSGSAGNLASNSASLTDDPSYQFFLDDGSGGNPGDFTASTSGNIALNAETSADPPLYDYFLDDASDGGAGQFSSSAKGDVSLFSTTDADPGTSNPMDDKVAALTSFPDLPQGNILGSLPGTDLLGASNSDPNLFTEASNLETSNSEPNLYTEGSDLAMFSSDPSLSTERSDLAMLSSDPSLSTEGSDLAMFSSDPSLSTEGSDLAMFNSDPSLSTERSDVAMFSSDPSLFTEGSDLNVASLPAEGGTESSISDPYSDLFADSLSTGSDLFYDVARKVRRQELQNPYPGLDGWTKTNLRRRGERDMGRGFMR